jgi:hypothetical protein
MSSKLATKSPAASSTLLQNFVYVTASSFSIMVVDECLAA